MTTNLTSSFERYLDSATDLALSTRRRYAREVRDFVRKVGATSLDVVTPGVLLAWYQELHDKGLYQGTMVQKIAALKQFLRYMEEFEESEHAGRLLKVLGRIKVPPDAAPKRQTHVLQPADIEELLAWAEKPPRFGKRDRALISFLWATGCRRNEVVTLTLADLDVHGRQASVLGKGNKPRTVYFDQECRTDLALWLIERRTWGPLCDRVFISATGKPLAPDTLGSIVSGVANRAGVKGVWTHLFRHTRITGLLNDGLSLQEVASFAGHTSVTTTMRYYHQDQVRLKERYDAVTQKQEDQESLDGLFESP